MHLSGAPPNGVFLRHKQLSVLGKSGGAKWGVAEMSQGMGWQGTNRISCGTHNMAGTGFGQKRNSRR